MEALASDLDSLDENDPRQGAQLMRKLFSATGMPVGGGMEEALRRMEAGEDPEKIRNAPYSTPVRRLDEAGAAKRPVIRQAM